ncbi:MAG: hypothetical protein Q4G35_10630 [Propionibacteriaceae bacterium]|nr:hypothetical protein [Propionibacteriaceae bacterium]
MLTTRQMLDGGLSRSVIRRLTGPWIKLMNGLYCTSPPTWHSAAWAGLLAGGPTGKLGGAAALFLDGVLRDPPQLITAWSSEARANLHLGGFDILLRRADRSSVGTIPRTRVEASLLDMADHVPEDDLTDAVVRAFTEGNTTASRLLDALEARGRNRHRVHLQELCTHAVRGIESALEWNFLRKVVDAHGLPRPILQPSSRFGRSDGRWPEYSLRLELDGRRDHQDGSRDWYRDNAHALHSKDTTLHYGWNASTKTACMSAQQVEEGLKMNGWAGTMCPCGLTCRAQRHRAA